MLDERKRQILRAVILDYIFTAEPVGSRSLVKRHDIGLSPATIRNEMSDLEEMGYLEQPHTSAGRIPSHHGYRFYVSSMMEEMELSKQDLLHLEELFNEINPGSSLLPRQIAKLLSSLTSYLSLISEPADKGQLISQVDIVPRSSEQATMVVVLSDGVVKYRSVTLPDGLDASQVKSLAAFVHHKLEGMRLSEINDALLADISQDFAGNLKLIDHIIKMVKIMVANHDEKIVMDGAIHLLEQPEFKDVNKVRDLLLSLEQDDQILKLLHNSGSDGNTIIKIGSDIGIEPFKDCSMVLTAFTTNDIKLTMGILGPTRMNYAKTLGFIKVFREYLNTFGGRSND